MLRTVEATVEEGGSLRLLEPVDLTPGARALVTLLGEKNANETAMLSQAALSDWEREEEDEAWNDLQR